MPMFGTPIAASRREPVRAVRLPEGVKLAIIDMIETGADFISAAKANGLQAQTMRRWLGRGEAISFLRKERARFRQSACAGNEHTLVEIRDDRDGNQMARVHAVRTLERLDEQASVSRAGEVVTPGVTIRLITVAPPGSPSTTPPTIDITPRREPEPAPLIDADPIFRVP